MKTNICMYFLSNLSCIVSGLVTIVSGLVAMRCVSFVCCVSSTCRERLNISRKLIYRIICNVCFAVS